MAVYHRGSTGPEVKQIQERLRELDQYRGPWDGIYGGAQRGRSDPSSGSRTSRWTGSSARRRGTTSSTRRSLPLPWSSTSPSSAGVSPSPARSRPEPRAEQLAWARSIQDHRRNVLQEPWRGLFRRSGRQEEFRESRWSTNPPGLQGAAGRRRGGGTATHCREPTGGSFETPVDRGRAHAEAHDCHGARDRAWSAIRPRGGVRPRSIGDAVTDVRGQWLAAVGGVGLSGLRGGVGMG